MIRIVVGVNWGDEGKGRMVDYFAKDADYVVRYQGGSNAGHTVINDLGTFKLHLIPSGVFHADTINIMGAGTVINLEAAVNEIGQLRNQGIHISDSNYKISDRAIISFPFHKLQDEYEEERLGNKKFGSTKQGIAPTYADKYSKFGIQIGTLFYPEHLKQSISRTLELKNKIFTEVYGKPAVSVDEMFEWALQYGDMLKPYICDMVEFFAKCPLADSNILLESQLGALRDIHYGIYPYTTSSSTLSGFGWVGAGLFSSEVPIITGVVKAFSTCVGEGPFISEMDGELAHSIRETALEYGASTGRPRRIGHFDLVATRYGAKIQNATEIALTKLDSLSGQQKLKICTHYRVGTKIMDYFPIEAELVDAEPVYIDVPGWTEDISKIRQYDKLPEAARNYVEIIQKNIGVFIKYISVGPERESLIVR